MQWGPVLVKFWCFPKNSRNNWFPNNFSMQIQNGLNLNLVNISLPSFLLISPSHITVGRIKTDLNWTKNVFFLFPNTRTSISYHLPWSILLILLAKDTGKSSGRSPIAFQLFFPPLWRLETLFRHVQLTPCVNKRSVYVTVSRSLQKPVTDKFCFLRPLDKQYQTS